MINLIPPSAKKSIIREYWKRTVTVWLCLFSVLFIMLAVFLLPTYVMLLTEIDNLADESSFESESIVKYDQSVSALKKANAEALLLLDQKSTTTPSLLITALVNYAGESIALNSFQLESLVTGGDVSVSGVASTRQTLANFRDKVAADSNFSSVNLPISNLIKEKDLLFTMTMTLASTTLNI